MRRGQKYYREEKTEKSLIDPEILYLTFLWSHNITAAVDDHDSQDDPNDDEKDINCDQRELETLSMTCVNKYLGGGGPSSKQEIPRTRDHKIFIATITNICLHVQGWCADKNHDISVSGDVRLSWQRGSVLQQLN